MTPARGHFGFASVASLDWRRLTQADTEQCLAGCSHTLVGNPCDSSVYTIGKNTDWRTFLAPILGGRPVPEIQDPDWRTFCPKPPIPPAKP